MSAEKLSTDIIRIEDALKFIDEIAAIYSYDQEMDQKELMAICYGILVVGEALNYVSKTTQSNYPHIQWRKIIDTRNRIIHGYGMVDKTMMAAIAHKHLPELKQQLLSLLSDLKTSTL